MPVLTAKNLVKNYRLPKAPSIRVLDGVSLSVEPGERVAVIGKSGSGKSTLLNLLGGLDSPDSEADSVLEISGVNLFKASERAKARLRAQKIGFVFQAFHLMPELTLLENAALPSLAVHGGGRKGLARAKALLEEAGLSERLSHKPRELSGGEQQRAAIVRALLNGPELLLADEPTGNLDPATGRQVLDLLFGLSGFVKVKPALVMVTHSEETASRCDRILRLESGKLVPA